MDIVWLERLLCDAVCISGISMTLALRLALGKPVWIVTPQI
jgi:hypothetical protein